MFFPRSLTPNARSILPRICWLGIALPDSYSLTFVKCISGFLEPWLVSIVTYNLRFFVDLLSEVLLCDAFFLTSLLDSTTHRLVYFWWRRYVVFSIQFCDTSVISVGMAGVGDSCGRPSASWIIIFFITYLLTSLLGANDCSSLYHVVSECYTQDWQFAYLLFWQRLHHLRYGLPWLCQRCVCGWQ